LFLSRTRMRAAGCLGRVGLWSPKVVLLLWVGTVAGGRRARMWVRMSRPVHWITERFAVVSVIRCTALAGRELDLIADAA
jgi:hypothetical protein